MSIVFYMASRELVVIRITEEARDALKGVKSDKESYSECILRLTTSSPSNGMHNNVNMHVQSGISYVENRLKKLEDVVFQSSDGRMHMYGNIHSDRPCIEMGGLSSQPPDAIVEPEGSLSPAVAGIIQKEGWLPVTPEVLSKLRYVVDHGLKSHHGSQRGFLRALGLTNGNLIKNFKSGGRGANTIDLIEYNALMDYGCKNCIIC